MPLILSLHPPPFLRPNPNQNPDLNLRSSRHHPPVLLRFRPSRRQKIQYLQTLGLDASSSPPEALDWTLSIVDYLKSIGFSDSHLPRLAFLCPRIFTSSDISRTLAPVLEFLSSDLSASPEQSRDLIVLCPEILVSSVQYRLRPTFQFLDKIGVKNLNTPTNLHAHLLVTPIEKLMAKVEFFAGLGLSHEESLKICARCPAIFGYSVEHNLRPKVGYLVYRMGRQVEEAKKFPHAFSLKKRIAPRHLHLAKRGVRVPLKKMLVFSDEKFYAKWT